MGGYGLEEEPGGEVLVGIGKFELFSNIFAVPLNGCFTDRQNFRHLFGYFPLLYLVNDTKLRRGKVSVFWRQFMREVFIRGICFPVSCPFLAWALRADAKHGAPSFSGSSPVFSRYFGGRSGRTRRAAPPVPLFLQATRPGDYALYIVYSCPCRSGRRLWAAEGDD